MLEGKPRSYSVDQERQQNNSQWIHGERRAQVAVQQLVQGAQRAASGAVPAADFVQQTRWKDSRSRGIENAKHCRPGRGGNDCTDGEPKLTSRLHMNAQVTGYS
jgi:hypothetical protein